MLTKTNKSFRLYLTLVLINSVFCVSSIGQTILNNQSKKNIDNHESNNQIKSSIIN